MRTPRRIFLRGRRLRRAPRKRIPSRPICLIRFERHYPPAAFTSFTPTNSPHGLNRARIKISSSPQAPPAERLSPTTCLSSQPCFKTPKRALYLFPTKALAQDQFSTSRNRCNLITVEPEIRHLRWRHPAIRPLRNSQKCPHRIIAIPTCSTQAFSRITPTGATFSAT